MEGNNQTDNRDRALIINLRKSKGKYQKAGSSRIRKQAYDGLQLKQRFANNRARIDLDVLASTTKSLFLNRIDRGEDDEIA